MVHRDVKPSNCLFVGGELNLADFGLLTEAHPLVSRLGTQRYMPPDGRMDMRADVYAAGLVIYEMLSGLPADDFPRLGRQSRPIVASPSLAALLRLALRACEREPEKRFADARAMLAELSTPVRAREGDRSMFSAWGLFAKNVFPPKNGPVFRQPARRRAIAAACVAALLTAGLGAWTLLPRRVAVSFVTEPYEAKIYLDEVLLMDPEKAAPYTTPCTAEGLPACPCRVSFEWEAGRPLDVGQHDLARVRQIVFRRP